MGGTGNETGKRHPTLGNNVIVGSGAKVLGNIAIGDNVRIGAGSVVIKPVPCNCTVTGVPAKIVKRDGKKVIDPAKEIYDKERLHHEHIPDMMSVMCR